MHETKAFIMHNKQLRSYIVGHQGKIEVVGKPRGLVVYVKGSRMWVRLLAKKRRKNRNISSATKMLAAKNL